jgi:acyl carrier protein
MALNAVSAAGQPPQRARHLMSDRERQLFHEIGDLVRRFAPAGAELRPETELTSDLNIDSVAAMDLVMEIEDKYGVDIAINQIAELRTLGDLVRLVSEATGAD